MASKSAATDSSGWSKWQIAIVLGTPVVIGVGFWLYHNSRKNRRAKGFQRGSSNSLDSLDGEASKSTLSGRPRSPAASTEDKVSSSDVGSLEVVSINCANSSLSRYYLHDTFCS